MSNEAANVTPGGVIVPNASEPTHWRLSGVYVFEDGAAHALVFTLRMEQHLQYKRARLARLRLHFALREAM